MERRDYTIADITKLGKDIGELNRLRDEGWEALRMVSTRGRRELRFVHRVDLLERRGTA